MITDPQKEVILRLLRPIRPRMVGIFGSYARSEEIAGSDLDILVDTDEDVNLLDIIGAEQALSEALQTEVDLITLRALNEAIRPQILEDLLLL